MHQDGRVGTDVAESLNDDPSLLAVHLEVLDRLIADNHHAASRRLAASTRTAHVQRLASHNGGNGLAHVHGVGVHHPRHDLLVRIDVGCGDVLLRADELDELSRVAAGETFQLAA